MNDVGIVVSLRVARSVVACARIARWLSRETGWPVYDSAEAIEVAPTDGHRTIVAINSPWHYADHRGGVANLIGKAERLAWIQNDYVSGMQERSLTPAAAWLDAGRPIARWTTIPSRVRPETRDAYVNWNAVHYEPLSLGPYPRSSRPRLVYWGAFREGRLEKLDRYFAPRPEFGIVVSAPGRAAKKFADRYANATIIDPLGVDVVGVLARLGGFALYVEDRKSEKMFSSLAGRFYEAVSAGLPQLVDAGSAETIRAGGVRLKDDWIVSSAADVAAKISEPGRLAEIRGDQMSAWRTSNHVIALKRQFNSAFERLYSEEAMTTDGPVMSEPTTILGDGESKKSTKKGVKRTIKKAAKKSTRKAAKKSTRKAAKKSTAASRATKKEPFSDTPSGLIKAELFRGKLTDDEIWNRVVEKYPAMRERPLGYVSWWRHTLTKKGVKLPPRVGGRTAKRAAPRKRAAKK